MTMPRLRGAWCAAAPLAVVLCLLMGPAMVRASDPYARTKDYDLENVRTHLRFDLENRKVLGETTQTLAIVRDGVERLKFDSVDLTIESVTLGGKAAKFETTPTELVVTLPQAAKRGEKLEVSIRYSGQPKKGLYFILPNKNYPDRPKEIWSQGEDEDTRYYIPIYDYPNDRTTSEMILTVPASWLTVSNGQLVSVKDDGKGMKTWDWKQTQTLSTYLISVVAGEFVEKKDTWRGMPLEYVVPRGDEDKIQPTFERTKGMLDVFSDTLGVRYPWAKYAQTSVDDFVVGGMENTSATTLTTRGLVNPKLAAEERAGSDSLNSHEMAHQWFGDLLTTKDWANLWLNEGFATYFEHLWTEKHYGNDEVAYEYWRDSRNWMRQANLYDKPIVTYDIKSSLENSGNIYNKGGWVLHMLREKLGDDDFWRAMHHYLETYRGQNVMTSDLTKAIEGATSRNVDEFFGQWIYGAGAPKFEVKSTYDEAAKQVKLEVKQTQKVEGRVGLFRVPIEVEVTTGAGRKSFPIEVSQATETFTFPVDGAPLMVLFDKGNKILKSTEFAKQPKELVYQLKNAETVPDRADAAVALGDVKGNEDVVAGLGDAAVHDPFWGVRREAITALGKIGGASAEKQVLAALENEKPWVREVAVQQLGQFKDDAANLGPRLETIAREDKAYTVRGAALRALGAIKAASAYDVLTAAVQSDSPDDTLRSAALNGLGELGDDRAVPLLLEWSGPGKPLDTRSAAIFAVAGLDKKNKDITRMLASYLTEQNTSVRFPTIFALGERGDPEAIGPLEALLKSGDLSIGMQPFVEGQIARLKGEGGGGNMGRGGRRNGAGGGAPAAEAAKGDDSQQILKSLEKLQQQVAEMNERLEKIETRLPADKK
jgi:aminopeptidase N